MKKVVVFSRRILLFIAFLLIMSFGKSIHAQALSYDKAICIKMVTKDYTGPNLSTRINLDDPYDHITNVKTSDSHLKAAVSFSASGDNAYDYEEIQMFATKRGKYKIFFDVVDKDGKLKSSESITVYVRTVKESLDAIKSIKIGKTEIKKQLLKDKYTTRDVDVKKSGKLKIKMKKGCKLKEIYVNRIVKMDNPEAYSNGSKITYTTKTETIQNGSMLILSEAGMYDKSVDNYGKQTEEIHSSNFSYTTLRLKFTDKNGALTTQYIIIRSAI